MYSLFQVSAGGGKKVGRFTQFFCAVEHAENKPEIENFKISDTNGRELMGARFSKAHGDSIYWRLKGREKRGRDLRFDLIALVV